MNKLPKFIPAFILLPFILVPLVSRSQTNTIFLKEGKATNLASKLAYGENILIKGELKNGIVTKVTIDYYYGVNKRTVKANISGNSWTAILDPLPIRTNLILEVKIERIISSEDLIKVKGFIQNRIELKVDSLINKLQKTGIDIDQYFKSNNWGDSIANALGSDFSGYYLINGTPFSEYSSGLINQEVSDELLIRLVNSRKSIQEIPFDQGLRIGFDSLLVKIDTISNKELIESLEKLFKPNEIEKLDIKKMRSEVTLLPDSVNKNIFLAVIASTDYDQIKVFNEATSSLLKALDTIGIRLKAEVFTVSMETTAETLGAENYLGVDLGTVLIDDIGTAGLFVLINPYWGKKIDPEKDPIGIREKVTPSFGFGFSGNDLEGKKPVYFVGVGLRLNRIVRASLGSSINKKSGAKHFDWNLAAGISINVNFVGDLLKLTSAAQSNAKTN